MADNPQNVGSAVEPVWVTPAMAEAWLRKFNGRNRPMNKYRVSRYAADMKNNRWEVTGEAISFSKNLLLDGQHRLAACVEAGTPFKTVVHYGLRESAQFVMDQGMPRTKGSHLSLLGHKRGRNLASAATAYWKMLGGRSRVRARGSAASNSEIIEIVETVPDLSQRLEEFYAMPYTPGVRVRPGDAVAFFTFIARHDEEKARSFFLAYLGGAGLSANDPAMAFRNRILSARTKGNKISGEEFLTLASYAWRAYVKGRKLTKLTCVKSLPQFPGDPGWGPEEQ